MTSSSSSDESPSIIQKKKGKLKSRRQRKGLAVIINEIWPHDGINARLADKNFLTVDSFTQMAFVNGILNPILDSDGFRKLQKKKISPKTRQKMKILNKLVHDIIRSQNFPEVRIMESCQILDDPDGSFKNILLICTT